jgi:hypothetical protein
MDEIRDDRNTNNVPELPDSVARFMGVAMGFIFGGIGLTVLIFLWAAPYGEFGSPPIFFRFFGSFIALAFLIFGAGSSLAMYKNRPPLNRRSASMRDGVLEKTSPLETPYPAGELNYTCPKCSAPLTDGAEVSPHGDVKCTFCNGWYNIHGK